MSSFLEKFKKFIYKNNHDAEIVGNVKFNENNVPYFVVKMQGCKTLVDIKAEDIIERFIVKFHQRDIKIATKMYMKYREMPRLITVGKNYAVVYHRNSDSYQQLDLRNNSLLQDIDIEAFCPKDAFLLGMYVERLRIEKDRKLLNLVKSGNNISYLKLIKQHE